MEGQKQADEILNLGGDIVGGVAYLNHKEVGRWNNGAFYVEPGTEAIFEAARNRKKAEKARILENAELLSKAEEQVPAVAKASTVPVPETPDPISPTEAATKMNSIPGAGPKNPVREDGDNNRSPAVEPTDTATLLADLGNLEGAQAVEAGKKAAAKTGTENKPK